MYWLDRADSSVGLKICNIIVSNSRPREFKCSGRLFVLNETFCSRIEIWTSVVLVSKMFLSYFRLINL